MVELISAAGVTSGQQIKIYLVFILAGWLVGGVWVAYKNDHKLISILLAIVVALLVVLGVNQLINTYDLLN